MLLQYFNGICLTASSVLKNLDDSVDPCDDFYRFACGNFMKKTHIPDDQSSVNIFSIIGDQLQEQLRSLFDEKPQPNEPKPFTLAKNLFSACMNTCKYFTFGWICASTVSNISYNFQRKSKSMDWIRYTKSWRNWADGRCWKERLGRNLNSTGWTSFTKWTSLVTR